MDGAITDFSVMMGARESSVDCRVTEKSKIRVCVFPHCGFQCTNNDLRSIHY